MEGVREAASFEGLIILAVIYWILNAVGKFGKKGGAAPAPPRPEGQSQPGGTQGEGFSLEAVLREIERVKHEAEVRAAPPPPPQPKPVPRDERPRRFNPASKPKPAGKSPRHLADTRNSRHLPNPAQGTRHLPDAAPSSRHLPDTERRGRMARAQDDRGPLGRHSSSRLPASEEFEDVTSLEEGSLEVPGRLENLDESRTRPRKVVDQDEGAEAVVARRIREAEARNQAFSEKDHRRFHDKIASAEPADAPKTRLTTAQLRNAFVWREILGPPKSLE